MFKHKWKRKNFLEYAVISPNGLQLRVDNHYFALSRILHILPSILPCPFILLCQRSCDVCAIELIASSKYESATAKPSKKESNRKARKKNSPNSNKLIHILIFFFWPEITPLPVQNLTTNQVLFTWYLCWRENLIFKFLPSPSLSSTAHSVHPLDTNDQLFT